MRMNEIRKVKVMLHSNQITYLLNTNTSIIFRVKSNKQTNEIFVSSAWSKNENVVCLDNFMSMLVTHRTMIQKWNESSPIGSASLFNSIKKENVVWHYLESLFISSIPTYEKCTSIRSLKKKKNTTPLIKERRHWW